MGWATSREQNARSNRLNRVGGTSWHSAGLTNKHTAAAGGPSQEERGRARFQPRKKIPEQRVEFDLNEMELGELCLQIVECILAESDYEAH